MEPSASRIPASLAALRHRNFRLLWFGLLVSNTGSFMQSAALLWHVSLLVPPEKKALALGFVGLVRVVPIVVFSLLSGVVADAWNRRSLMLLTQTVAALVAVTLAILAFHGIDAVWPIYVLAAFGGATAAFDLPARQALLPMLVAREDLPNAIGLNTIMFQAASVLGPAAGGILIAAAHVGWTYALNAISFLCVIVALLRMRGVDGRPPLEPGVKNDVSLAAALEGLRFVFRSPMIRSTMLLDFFATFFSSATALLPIFAQDVLHVGAKGYGWLYAAPAAGALVTSAIMVPAIERIEKRGAHAAVGGRGLRRGHRRLRRVALVLGGARRAGRDRRGRHGEHGHSKRHSTIGDAGPIARAHDRSEHGVLHGRPAAGRAGGGARRPVEGRAVLRRDRWDCVHSRNGLGCRGDAVAAKVRKDRGNGRGVGRAKGMSSWLRISS